MNEKHKTGEKGRSGKGKQGEHGHSRDVGHASEEVVRSGNLAFGPPPDDKGPPRVVSGVERGGVPSTDTEARSPLGVGTSEHRGAEKTASRKKEAGREKVGTDERGRPYGVSHPEDVTGISPRKPGRGPR
ncbi:MULTISPECIES: hypothetical protein [unclassified Streptosporangium]|uniref:hypothetical protein n=1 Tax=unclassified Streptosporangium TaxID=2632669 RepID=UPI002E293213|nr:MULTISPECIES: hypothetical protein [unclassified Streptosporangium]